MLEISLPLLSKTVALQQNRLESYTCFKEERKTKGWWKEEVKRANYARLDVATGKKDTFPTVNLFIAAATELLKRIENHPAGLENGPYYWLAISFFL